jgi:hypothetical protein
MKGQIKEILFAEVMVVKAGVKILKSCSEGVLALEGCRYLTAWVQGYGGGMRGGNIFIVRTLRHHHSAKSQPGIRSMGGVRVLGEFWLCA